MIRKIFFVVFAIFLMYSCNSKNDNPNTTNNNKQDNTNNTNVVLLDDYSKFISGIKTKTFADIQDKNFYKNYSKSIKTTWNYFYLNQLLVITKWGRTHNLISANDSTSVFYPFSGPDFPFVYAFYPYAKNYLLIGLENVGVIPDIANYSDMEINNYINSISSSLSFFFQNGYFSTEIMKNSFRNENMNGVIHPLLFFITRTGNKIENLRYFVLDNYGRIEYLDVLKRTEKRIKGVELSFTGMNGHKELFYLQVDLSDQNFVNHSELITFISKFNEKNVFIKSASYLLQDDSFNFFRDFLIKQSVKIIQDDSGFGYEFLKNSKFNVELYGNYSQTLNIFEEYWQESLKIAYSKTKNHDLPFRFGYNIPFDEMSLIYASKKVPEKIKYPIYKIQVKMSWNKISEDSFPEELRPLDYYYDEGYYKYTCGNFTNISDARLKLEVVKKKGFKDAFILKLTDSERKIVE